MAIAVDFLGLAEGAAVDSKGTLTLVGFNPHFLDFAELPRRLMLSVVLIVTDDSPEATSSPEFSFDVNITDPRGAPVAGLREVAPAQKKKHARLPTSTTVVFSTLIDFKRYGKYTAQLVVRVLEDGDEATASRSLFVVPDPNAVVNTVETSEDRSVASDAAVSP